MRALLVVLAAALALLAAASPTVPVRGGPDGRVGRDGPHGLARGDGAVAAGVDAGTGEHDSLQPARKERPRCPPVEPCGPHCVYLTLKKPSKAAAEKLAGKLRTDGVESDVSEEHVVAVALGDAQLAKLLGTKVAYSLTGASASDRLICDARVAAFEPPARYREVASVRIDAQCP